MSTAMHDDLEQRLRDLAAHLEFPPTPALTAQVRARLATTPAATHRPALRVLRPGRLQLTSLRRRAAAGLLAVAALVAVVLAVPPARTAVAHWLGIRGVEIVPVPSLPPVPTATVEPPTPAIPGDTLSLGLPEPLAQAEVRAGFQALIPASFGPPDAVWVRDEDGGVITLVYRPRPGYPEVQSSGVGLLVTEFRGSFTTPLIQKFVEPDTRIIPVGIAGGQGYWIDGVSALAFRLPGGNDVAQTLRLTGPTLVFEHGDLTVRIEGATTQAQAVAIAQSLR